MATEHRMSASTSLRAKRIDVRVPLVAALDRIYTAEGLSVRKCRRPSALVFACRLVAALTVYQAWSLDFVSDVIARPGAVARRIKCLTVADDFSHECVGISVDFGIGGA